MSAHHHRQNTKYPKNRDGVHPSRWVQKLLLSSLRHCAQYVGLFFDLSPIHHYIVSYAPITILIIFCLCLDADAELFGFKVNSDPFADADSNPDPFGSDPPVKPQVNGRESSSPEMFDLSRLAPPLSAPPTRVCRTPEAFLGPTGASLVNLDALIPSNPPSKMHNNPFLSGNQQPFKNTQEQLTFCT